MNQNTPVDNDLQKAIDDITKSTNMDPVFADAVAAPAPAPIDVDAPTYSEMAPASRPTPRMSAPRPAMPRPAMPTAPRPITPNIPTPNMANMPMPPVAPIPEPTRVEIATPPEPPVAEPINVTEVTAESTTETITTEPVSNSAETPSDMRELRDAALRDLAPLVDKIDATPSQKFNIYRDIHENLHDNTVIAPAYDSAKNIADDHERGEALLYLIESIDKM